LVSYTDYHEFIFTEYKLAASLPQLCAPLITFAAFIIRAKVNGSQQLSTAQAFTSLAIISLITNPALQLLASIPAITAAFGCFSRIHRFLVSSSIVNIQDYTSVLNSKLSAPSDRDCLPRDTGETIEMRYIKTKEATERADSIILNFSDAIIRPVRDSTFCLQDIDWYVEQETLTILTGPVGCGKTTLLKAILGEIPLERGVVKRTTSEIAYCRQSPWLQNTSIMNIVCGPSALDLEWYREVLRSCALDHEISQMPLADKSIIGSRALTLSGGQKQRLVSNIPHPSMPLIDRKYRL
jgi:ABC-type bacteriocin/lantibiotic exporter with double-glycine peptidase domain